MTRGIDLSRPVLVAVAALLAVMIVLPVGWLLVVSLTGKEGGFTLANFVALFTDPTFVDPLITTLIIACSVSATCCLVAAPLGWLVARTDGQVERWRCDPQTLKFDRSTHRYDMRWFVLRD